MPATRILLGVIGRPHGTGGLVRITSYADPPAAIMAHGALSDDSGRQFVLRWRGDGLAEIAEIVDQAVVKVADRSAAGKLTNRRLYVARDRLPEPAADEFYFADLVGLVAVDAAGTEVGTVVAVHDYGGGASLEIAAGDTAPVLVPFTHTAVPVVDIGAGRVTVSVPVHVDVLARTPPPASSGSPLPLAASRTGREDDMRVPLRLREPVAGRSGSDQPP